PHPLDAVKLLRLVGPWRWLHAEREAGTLRIERERWLFDRTRADPATGHARADGRYRRDVLVIALDGAPFLCNQQPFYLQSAVVDVTARVDDAGEVAIDEGDYQVAPSPCEPGFRHLGAYQARIHDRGMRVTLTWDGGDQTLDRLPDDALTAEGLALTPPPAPPAGLAGAWHWRLVDRDGELDVREEDEAWEIAIAADGVAGATYRREVTIRSPDGAPIACAGAPSYSFVDRYVLRGRFDGEVLALEETAVEPGQHPCLAATPSRHLDTLTGELEGADLVLTWRGKRRQVLHRHRR
ncbi:MAG: hypothetical protein H6708_34480, partial [Kofleriaceae bacterium]|nr:hypothetical protein [Kofleriaceae bacterium]